MEIAKHVTVPVACLALGGLGILLAVSGGVAYQGQGLLVGDLWQRLGFGGLGVALIVVVLVIDVRSRRGPVVGETELHESAEKADLEPDLDASGVSTGSHPEESMIALQVGEAAKHASVPEVWPDKLLAIELLVDCAHRERASGLGNLAVGRMKTLGFNSDVCTRFEMALTEAKNNLFDHGCTPGSGGASLLVEIVGAYASFTVTNSHGRSFDLDERLRLALKAQLAGTTRRGRGLLYLVDCADTLSGLPFGRGVKAVFERDPVKFARHEVEDLTVASLESGIHNYSLSRRTVQLASGLQGNKLLLDFSAWGTGGSAIWTAYIDAARVFREPGKVVALLMPWEGDYGSPLLLSKELAATDLETALSKLDRRHLLHQVSKLLGQPEKDT